MKRLYLKNLIFVSLFLISTSVTYSVSGETKPATKNPPPAEDNWGFLPDPVATIGEEKISKAAFISDMENQFKFKKGKKLPQQQLKSLSKQVLNGIVDQKILLILAARSGIKPSPMLVKDQVKKMLKTMTPDEAKQFSQALKKDNCTIKDYENKMANNVKAQEGLAIDLWIGQKVANKAVVTDKEVENFYKNSRQLFKKPETVDASHILYKPLNDSREAKLEAKQKAEKALQKLKKGYDFGKLAEQDSACPSGRKRNGNLGEFGRNQMVPEFEKVAFSLKPGELSNVVETKFGYHIIKLHKHNSESTIPLDLARNKIKSYLKRKKETEIIEKLIQEEKKKLKVIINLK